MRVTPTFFTLFALMFFTFLLTPLLLLSLVGVRSIRYYMSRWWASRILWAAGVKLQVEGVEELQKGGPFVFLPNHQSFMDVPVVMYALPVPFRMMAKQELFWVPILGLALYLMGYIGVDRGNPRLALRSVRVAEKKAQGGESLVIFPEGRISEGEHLGPFKKGGFWVAKRLGVPIVPVCLIGTHRVLARGRRRVRPGRVKVIIGKPRPAEGDLDELAEKTRAELEEVFNKGLRDFTSPKEEPTS
jgi:1-acyl-sn-glycerol-3-phosphate acyltransferase